MQSKKPLKLLILFITVFFSFKGNAQTDNIQFLRIDSTAIPKLFAAGIISTPFTEWSTSFTPDQQTVYTSRGAVYWTIICSKFKDGQWQKPSVVSFSGRWRDTDPFISHDGKRIFFISNRPAENSGSDKPQKVFHIWYADKSASEEWTTPHELNQLINIDSLSNYSPSADSNMNLYFCSQDREGHSGMQSFVARFDGHEYKKPEVLSIKGVDEVQDPFIAPDDRYLLFVSNNTLYISYRKKNEWTTAEKLSTNVNNGDGISSPYISQDKKMLYYSTARIQGFYKRDPTNKKLSYDDLMKENNNCFNGSTNILMIPVYFSDETLTN
ncbi:MAG: hypothetical protein ABJB05_02265 [Parafilimonas sp.]